MSRHRSIRHHFVPQFLMRPFCSGDGLFYALRWNRWRGQVEWRRYTPGQRGYRIDLYSLSRHPEGRDVLERIFFGDVDQRGAELRKRMVATLEPPAGVDDRSAWARLIMSLDSRRPNVVHDVRRAAVDLRAALDNDPEIRAAFAAQQIQQKPSDWYESLIDAEMEDVALTMLQKIIDNAKVGSAINSCFQGVSRIGRRDGEFILADRPMIRTNGFDHRDVIWALPLSPRVTWWATPNPATARRLKRSPGKTLRRLMNESSVGQADEMVISQTLQHLKWIGRHLPRHENDRDAER